MTFVVSDPNYYYYSINPELKICLKTLISDAHLGGMKL